MNHRAFVPYLLAIAVALPGLGLRLAGIHLPPIPTALISGASILAASFLLLWACDAAQADVSQALALAVVALLAVLPEYAVDMYITWQAGKFPESHYTGDAIANMTGANRLLIGVAWGAIALLYWLRFRRPVRLGPERKTELVFLGLATVYAFIIPLKGTLAWYDGLVFIGLYAWYVVIASKRPCVEVDAEGPAELLVRLPKAARRVAIGGLFLFAGGVILASAKPFVEGLIHTGTALGIPEFHLIQWLAPIASEAPEFTVALVFAWRGQAGLALGSLLAAKLNQWTLLVGMIPGVFALSHWSLAHPLPMGQFQMHEILLTAAQSLLAVMMLASMRFSIANALLLFALFIGQLIVPFFVHQLPQMVFNLGIGETQVHLFFSVLYLMATATLFLQRPRRILRLAAGLKTEAPPQPAPCLPSPLACGPLGMTEYDEQEVLPRCLKCKWRLSGIRAVASEVR